MITTEEQKLPSGGSSASPSATPVKSTYNPDVDAYVDPVPVEELAKAIEPIQTILNDGETPATLFGVTSPDQVPQGLVQKMYEEFNGEIERGDTYPQYVPYDIEGFKTYWFTSFVAILVRGHVSSLEEAGPDWSSNFLGTFYIKPNYQGRCAHVCNAGYVVNASIRGKRIGSTMGELFLKWGPRLNYTYVVYNLVFVTNVASIRIWERLGFERIGYIKGVARLRGYAKPVDAIMFGKDLVDDSGAPLN